MATMASTSHGLSVFANTCVKSPLNPKTGLSASLRERTVVKFNGETNGLSNTFNGKFHNEEWNRDRPRPNPALSIEDLQAAKEEEFYEKLLQLKSENEKTMQAYERLYKEKLLIEGITNPQPSGMTSKLDKSGIDRDIDNETSSLVVNGTGQIHISDETAALAKKPPPGKNKMVSEYPTISRDEPQLSLQSLRKARPNSAPTNRRSQSLDGDQWRDILIHTQNESPDNYIIESQDTLRNDHENNLKKINSMWDDFEITSALQRRHSFSSAQRKSSESIEDKKAKTTGWRHRITMPKPFNMSIREALKEKKKTSAQLELEARRQAKEREEEAECEKKFKAQPAPSHIYIPLYDELMEKNETRRKYVKQYCQDLLQSKVKPFSFDTREKDKHHQKMMNTPPMKEKPLKTKFKAAPVPKHIFSPKIDDKFLEDEELRKIRIKMRSKELLRESSLPPNMALRESLKEQEKKENAKKAKAAEKQKKRRPRSAYAVPDYDTMYKEFQKELARRKVMKEGTVVEPFDLETEHIRISREKIRRDMEKDEQMLKENRWPYQNSRETPRSSLKYLGALSTSMDAIPAYSTKSADLRSSVVKKDKERYDRRAEEEKEAEARRRMRENKLRKYLNEKTDSVPKPRESIATRLKKIKQDDRERQENYQRELQEMKARVDSSPLLVEKFIKENAKKEAEKKFSSTLHGAGVDDYDYTSYRGSHAQSSRSIDDHDALSDYQETGHADQTYTKDYPDEERYESDQ